MGMSSCYGTIAADVKRKQRNAMKRDEEISSLEECKKHKHSHYYTGWSCLFVLALIIALSTLSFYHPSLSRNEHSQSSIHAQDYIGSRTTLANILQPLSEPPMQKAQNGVLTITLRVKPTRIAVGPVVFTTRTYESSIPGPTISVQPGDTIKITLVNELEPNIPGPYLQNTFHHPNTTNLHFHGMHVDPTGISDNVFRFTYPGEISQTVVQVPLDHPRGMFLYHPHHHGSSFLQMGGGMTGAIIVEDLDNELSPEYKEIDRNVIIFQEFQFKGGLMSSLTSASRATKSNLSMNIEENQFTFPHASNQTYTAGLDLISSVFQNLRLPSTNHFVTVNGQFLPKIRAVPRKPQVLRLANAGANSILIIPAPTGCSFVKLSSDGIYLREPRVVPHVILSPSNRAEILLSCEKLANTSSLLIPLESISKDSNVIQYLGRHSNIYRGLLAFIELQTEKEVDSTLNWNSIKFPKPSQLYIEDLTSPSIKVADPFIFNITRGHSVERGNVWYSDYLINGQVYSGYSIRNITLGEVQEWKIINEFESKNHPFHIHTNPFQIVSMSHGMHVDYEIGEWRDVIPIPTPGNVTIRFRPLNFTGDIVTHCHILGHADAGMVAGIRIV